MNNWTFETLDPAYGEVTEGPVWDGSGLLFTRIQQSRIMRYDPAAKSWTAFDLPTRGSEARYVSLLERDGKMQVVLPYFRARKVAVMSFRSEADLAALKAQAGQ